MAPPIGFFFRRCAAWLVSMVSVAMLASCEISWGTGPSGSPGFPYADFQVDGIVLDEIGQPLGGIRVYYRDTWYGLTYTDTQPDGRFSLYGTFTPSGIITITAVDMGDGQNWGTYFDAVVTVPLELQDDTLIEGDEWFAGLYTGWTEIQMIRE